MNALGNCQQCGEQKPCNCASMTKDEAKAEVIKAAHNFVQKLKEFEVEQMAIFTERLNLLEPFIDAMPKSEAIGLRAEIEAILDGAISE